MSSPPPDDLRTAATWAPGVEPGVHPRTLELPDRYADQGRLGQGSMGEVRRVHDRELGRTVAMKILRWELAEHDALRGRFLEEARVVAALQHPGIVAVYDRGLLPDGRPWFTMPEVRGTTLAELDEGWPLRRLVGVLRSACNAVAYAHEAGVVHRDLKPSNVMVGAFGQVLVLDWGIALADAARGGVAGTPAWMAPEQRRADGTVGPPADVYALGGTLFTLLTRTPPPGSAEEARQALAEAGPLPDPLVALVLDALQPVPERRPPDADAFGARLSDWLEGEARRRAALSLVERAAPVGERARALREEAAAHRREARALLAGVQPFDPVERKAPAWDLEARAREAERAATLAETEHQQLLRAALEQDAALPEAHAALADLYQGRMAEAEARRDAGDAARFEMLLRAHDRGRHAGWLAGRGALSLRCDPPGATVEIHRYVLQRRVLVPQRVATVRAEELREHPLERGSYLLVLRAPGRAEVRYPALIERAEHHDGVAPGEDIPRTVVLPRAGAPGPDDLVVPAGWYLRGGDPQATDGLPRARVWVEGMVVRRWPVLVGEYLAWLDRLVAEGRGDEAQARVPREPQSGPGADRPLAALGPAGRYLPQPDGEGVTWPLDWPVTCVSWDDARAFADGVSTPAARWRLPHDHEWEKAARGVDGRFFPWGDDFDPVFTCMSRSRRGPPRRAGVDAFPTDCGPYGVRGAAGNAAEWCLNGYQREGPPFEAGRLLPTRAHPSDPFRVTRGGSWRSSEAVCRLSSRFVGRPQDRLSNLGFRLVRPLSPPTG
ncbi:MAG: SUMF1/EgtB/PvdO family nonheme iron enzyme [Alphaproteobacteria bacterium]|nr:SUMF1/EgtB/PvdO family nonheme iron enzyme [Alphaproteobacteria bacterium]